MSLHSLEERLRADEQIEGKKGALTPVVDRIVRELVMLWQANYNVDRQLQDAERILAQIFQSTQSEQRDLEYARTLIDRHLIADIKGHIKMHLRKELHERIDHAIEREVEERHILEDLLHIIRAKEESKYDCLHQFILNLLHIIGATAQDIEDARSIVAKAR